MDKVDLNKTHYSNKVHLQCNANVRSIPQDNHSLNRKLLKTHYFLHQLVHNNSTQLDMLYHLQEYILSNLRLHLGTDPNNILHLLDSQHFLHIYILGILVDISL